MQRSELTALFETASIDGTELPGSRESAVVALEVC